jgi:hypothetical protein
MVDGSGQRRSRECYKCVMTNPSANDRCMSRSIAPMRSFTFSADRDLLEFSRLRNKSTSLRSLNICSRLTATSFVKFLLLSRANEGASASCSVYHSAGSFIPNICSPLTVTSFVKFESLSDKLCFERISTHFTSHFEINFALLYLALDISISNTFGILQVIPDTLFLLKPSFHEGV